MTLKCLSNLLVFLIIIYMIIIIANPCIFLFLSSSFSLLLPLTLKISIQMECKIQPQRVLGRGILLELKSERLHRITKSQSGRGCKGALWSSSPTPLPKQGHLQQAAQDLVQVGLEYVQRRRIHSLPGQPVPVLRHPQSEEVLPHVQLELPMLQFVPIAPCPVTGHH